MLHSLKFVNKTDKRKTLISKFHQGADTELVMSGQTSHLYTKQVNEVRIVRSTVVGSQRQEAANGTKVFSNL